MFSKFLKYAVLIPALVGYLSVNALAAETYIIDTSHSSIGFAVKHLGVATTKGEFTDYTGTIVYDPEDPSAFNAEALVESASINTRNDQRDGHLRSADFFDVENYPAITFKSGQLRHEDYGYVLDGDLTIKEVTKPISIPVVILGPITGPKGGDVIGLAGETVINRQDFGVSWSKQMDNGGLVVSDEVTITVDIEAHKK